MKFVGNQSARLLLIVKENILENASAYVFIAALAGFAAWSLVLGQDANWDIRNYHYYNAYALFTDRLNYDIAPAQVQTYFNPAVDLLPFLLIQHFPPLVFGIVLGGWHGLNLWLLFMIGRVLLLRINFPRAGVWAGFSAVVGVMGAGAVSEVGTTLHDLTLSVFILGAILLCLQSWPNFMSATEGPAKGKLLLAGFLLGVASGLKLALAIYAVGMGVAVLVIHLGMLKRSREVLSFGAAALFGFLLAAGPWMWVLWNKYGNPFFPMYNSIFHSPYYSNENFLDRRFFPKSIYEALTFPLNFSLTEHAGCELDFNDAHIAVLYVGSIIACAYLCMQFMSTQQQSPAFAGHRQRDFSVAWLCIFIWVSYLIWLKTFAIYRYLICVELLSPIAFVALVGSFGKSKTVHGWLMAALLLMAFSVQAPAWGRLPWGDSFFGTQTPSLAKPENSLVLISSTNPLAYLIPSFPSAVRFIRIESNFLNPRQSTALTDRIKTVLAEADKDFYLLTDKSELSQGVDIVNQYLHGRAVQLGQCEPVASRVDSTLAFCKLLPKQE